MTASLPLRQLQERAAQVNASKTEVILSALADYLESMEDIPLTMRLSRLETQVGKLQGSLEKKVSELSTHYFLLRIRLHIFC